MKECSKGRLQIATVIVVLCLCGAGLATYFALRSKGGLDITYPPEPNGTCNVSFELSKSPVYIGDENVGMTCTISKCAKLRRVDILHKKEETGRTETIATITTNSQYINKSRMTLIEVKMSSDSAILQTVVESALSCQDKGQYCCTASASENLVYNETLELNLLDNAEVPLIFMTSVANENGTMDIICRGHVGAPAKEIFLEVKFHDSTSFYMFWTTNSTNTTLKDCDNERETNFTIITTQNWNNSLVRCSVKNESNNVLSSEEREIIIVPVVTLEPSKGRVYIGDRDFSMTCVVSGHKDLKSVEIYHEPEQLGTRERIAFVTKQNRSEIGGIIILGGSNMTDERAFLRINFTNLTCADGGIYQCVAIGNFNLTSVLKLDISSEPNVPTLTPPPWIVENTIILRERMFRCEGMVGKPASRMFVEANISGSFQEYLFPSIPLENNATEAQCNTKQLYQFYNTFNMSWNGIAIRCAVKNARTNETIRSSLHILMVINKDFCVGKEDYLKYSHPYECRKFIKCYNSTVSFVYTCGNGLCFGGNEWIPLSCTSCTDPHDACFSGRLI